MRKGEERTHHQRWPNVDDANIRHRDEGLLLLSDAVYFTRVTENGRFFKMSPVVEPTADCMQRVLPLFGPIVDVGSESQRLKLHGLEHRIRRMPSMFASFAGHMAFVSFWIFSIMSGGFLRDRLFEKPQFVEVTFGTVQEELPTAPTLLNEGASAMDKEATKLAQQLPQLTKSFAVEAAEKQPDAIPALTPTPIVAKATPKPTASPRVVVEATPLPGTKVLKAEEILKRLEREKREVGAKEKAGTHKKGGAGVKDAFNALPADPFAAAGTVPTNLTSGSLDGKVSVQAQAYQMAALGHVKRFWSLSDFQKFDSALSCKVEVLLNMFGKVMSSKIVKGSGNAEFDEQALTTIERANPFPDFSNENIQKRTLILNFRPREIK